MQRIKLLSLILILAITLPQERSFRLLKHRKKRHHTDYRKLAMKVKKNHNVKKIHSLVRKLVLKLSKMRKKSKHKQRMLMVPIMELLEACRILLQAEEHLIIEATDISGGTMNIELPKDPPTIIMNQLPLQHVHYYRPTDKLREMNQQEIPVYLL